MKTMTEIADYEKKKMAEAITFLDDLTRNMCSNIDRICIGNAMDYSKICTYLGKITQDLKSAEGLLNCILNEEIKREEML